MQLRTFIAAALVALSSHTAKADEFETNLTGTVSFVVGQLPATKPALAALGVTVGAQVSATIRIESDVMSVPTSNPDIIQWLEPTKSLVITIGSYQIVQDVPKLFEGLNFIQVGDDLPGGGTVADTYSVTTPMTDTDLILAGSFGPGKVTGSLLFSDFDGKTGSDDGVIQDLSAYPVATAIFGGEGGSISILWSTGGTGGGPGGSTYDPAKCTKDHLKGAAKFGKAVLACKAKRAKQPAEKDPFGTKENACVTKAFEKFQVALGKAGAKAAKKGGVCTLPDVEGIAAELAFLNALATLTDAVLTDFDADDKNDRVLRGKLLKAAASQWAKDAAAYAKDATKPNADKLAKALDKSSAALVKQADKAIEKAAAKGVVYTGPSASQLTDDVRAIVDDFVALTGG